MSGSSSAARRTPQPKPSSARGVSGGESVARGVACIPLGLVAALVFTAALAHAAAPTAAKPSATPKQAASDTAKAAAAPDSNVFVSVAAGISIRKPAAWRFVTRDQVLENRTRVRMKDSEWDSLVQQHASLPLVAMTKHQEPFESLNPSCGVTARPLGSMRGQSAKSLLTLISGQFGGAFKGFEIVAPVESTGVSGLPAARMRFRYTLSVEGHGDMKALSRLWVVPHGSVLFLVGQGGPVEGPDVSEEEFAVILKSLRIEP